MVAHSCIYTMAVHKSCKKMFVPYGLLIVGCFLLPVLSNPAAKDETRSPADAVKDSVQTLDYEDTYSEDEEGHDEQAGATSANHKSTLVPYFEVTERKVFQKIGEPITLECPVKNFDAVKHEILWYKGEHPITMGKHSLSGQYSVDDQYNLMIGRANETTAGSYYCRTKPESGSLHIQVEVGAERPTDGGGGGGDDATTTRDSGSGSVRNQPTIQCLLLMGGLIVFSVAGGGGGGGGGVGIRAAFGQVIKF